MARIQVHSAQQTVNSQASSVKQTHVNKSTAVQRHQPKNVTSPSVAQVYRPTSVRTHPDAGFDSGAWLFDQACAPQWLVSQLPSTPVYQRTQAANTNKLNMVKNSTNAQVIKLGSVKAKNASDDDGFNSGAWLFDASVAPQWLSSQLFASSKPNSISQSLNGNRNHLASVILAGSVKANLASPDDGFDTGAWLFDMTVAPHWLSSQLISTSQSKTILPKKQVPCAHTNNSSASVIKVGSIKAKNASPDDGFDTGSWLFDASVAPQWLSSQLPSQTQNNKTTLAKQVIRPQSGYDLKKSITDATRRSHSVSR